MDSGGLGARQHHVEIMKYGLASCNRDPHATRVDIEDVARFVRLVKEAGLEIVPLKRLDRFLATHYGMSAPHHNKQLRHSSALDALGAPAQLSAGCGRSA